MCSGSFLGGQVCAQWEFGLQPEPSGRSVHGGQGSGLWGFELGHRGPARLVRGTSPVWPCPCSWEPHPPQLPRYPDSSRGVSPPRRSRSEGMVGGPGLSLQLQACWCLPGQQLGAEIHSGHRGGAFSFIVWGFSAWKCEIPTPPHTQVPLAPPLLVHQSLKSPR